MPGQDRSYDFLMSPRSPSLFSRFTGMLLGVWHLITGAEPMEDDYAPEVLDLRRDPVSPLECILRPQLDVEQFAQEFCSRARANPQLSRAADSFSTPDLQKRLGNKFQSQLTPILSSSHHSNSSTSETQKQVSSPATGVLQPQEFTSGRQLTQKSLRPAETGSKFKQKRGQFPTERSTAETEKVVDLRYLPPDDSYPEKQGEKRIRKYPVKKSPPAQRQSPESAKTANDAARRQETKFLGKKLDELKVEIADMVTRVVRNELRARLDQPKSPAVVPAVENKAVPVENMKEKMILALGTANLNIVGVPAKRPVPVVSMSFPIVSPKPQEAPKPVETHVNSFADICQLPAIPLPKPQIVEKVPEPEEKKKEPATPKKLTPVPEEKPMIVPVANPAPVVDPPKVESKPNVSAVEEEEKKRPPEKSESPSANDVAKAVAQANPEEPAKVASSLEIAPPPIEKKEAFPVQYLAPKPQEENKNHTTPVSNKPPVSVAPLPAKNPFLNIAQVARPATGVISFGAPAAPSLPAAYAPPNNYPWAPQPPIVSQAPPMVGFQPKPSAMDIEMRDTVPRQNAFPAFQSAATTFGGARTDFAQPQTNSPFFQPASNIGGGFGQPSAIQSSQPQRQDGWNAGSWANVNPFGAEPARKPKGEDASIFESRKIYRVQRK